MGYEPEFDPVTILDSDLEDAIKSCVRAFEPAWQRTFSAENVNVAQEELFTVIFAKCVKPVTDELNA